MRYSGLQFSFSFFLPWPVELLISPWRLKSEAWVGLQEVWRLDSARNVQLPCFWSGGEPFSHVSWAPPFPVFFFCSFFFLFSFFFNFPLLPWKNIQTLRQRNWAFAPATDCVAPHYHRFFFGSTFFIELFLWPLHRGACWSKLFWSTFKMQGRLHIK